jgi:two-component system, cell cycle response regulator DivK
MSEAILVVDDQRDARKMLAEYLAFCGFSVHQAQDGLDALDVARRVCPRMILMDLMMPRMDGWEATRRLRADERTKAITVISVSAYSQQDEQLRARRAGCDLFVPKPYDLDQLVRTVRRLLDCGPQG